MHNRTEAELVISNFCLFCRFYDILVVNNGDSHTVKHVKTAIMMNKGEKSIAICAASANRKSLRNNQFGCIIRFVPLADRLSAMEARLLHGAQTSIDRDVLLFDRVLERRKKVCRSRIGYLL